MSIDRAKERSRRPLAPTPPARVLADACPRRNPFALCKSANQLALQGMEAIDPSLSRRLLADAFPRHKSLRSVNNSRRCLASRAQHVGMGWPMPTCLNFHPCLFCQSRQKIKKRKGEGFLSQSEECSLQFGVLKTLQARKKCLPTRALRALRARRAPIHSNLSRASSSNAQGVSMVFPPEARGSGNTHPRSSMQYSAMAGAVS